MTYLEYRDSTSASTEDIRNTLLYSIWQRVQQGGQGGQGGLAQETKDLIKSIADLLDSSVERTNYLRTITAHDSLTLALPSNINRTSWFIQNPPIYLSTILYIVGKTNPLDTDFQQADLPPGYFYIAELLPGQIYTESTPNTVTQEEIYCMTKGDTEPSLYPQVPSNEFVLQMFINVNSYQYTPIIWETF
jgi:hypothetical protein